MADIPALLNRLMPDRFILILIGAMLLAIVLPAGAGQAQGASLAAGAAVFVVFLLHGIRLPRQQVIDGVRNWQVQGSLMLFVFGVMPLAGFALLHLFAPLLPPLLALGLLYCGVLPTTVQSATTYTHQAGGNVAISVVASALINLAAIVVTPALFALLAGRTAGADLSGALLPRIALMLLLPFVIGQAIQKWARPTAMRHPRMTRIIDQGAIAVAVYVAFSAAVIEGIWGRLIWADLSLLALAIVTMLAVGFGGGWLMARNVASRSEDRAAMLFVASHKSIAVGAPLATLLFPPAAAGVILLPILIYHMAQLIISSWIAPALARRSTVDG